MYGVICAAWFEWIACGRDISKASEVITDAATKVVLRDFHAELLFETCVFSLVCVAVLTHSFSVGFGSFASWQRATLLRLAT